MASTLAHEHVFTDGWIRDGVTFRACACGVYDNPYAVESDFDYPRSLD